MLADGAELAGPAEVEPDAGAETMIALASEIGPRSMRTRRSRRRCATAVGVLLIAAGASAAAAEKSFSLAITGAEGTRYAGQCTLTTAAGDETVELSGVVPRHQEFMAETIACRIESAGLITVEIAHDGSLSRSSINGGTAHVAAR